MRLLLAILCISTLLPLAADAQAPTAPDPAIASADKAYTAQDWTAAESQYAALVRQHPESTRFWYRLGFSARANKHYDVALEAMQKRPSAPQWAIRHSSPTTSSPSPAPPPASHRRPCSI